MLTLTFRPLHGESSVLVRGTHFRICADATLRGPDNTIAARYQERLWQLGPRYYRSFECSGPTYLRVTSLDGGRESLGPYDFIKAIEGAIYAPSDCLGCYALTRIAGGMSAAMWQEIVFLTSA